ncbi:MAG: helix-turn-helix transcriptional regulator [Clostridia bacterium]|nr:helix-turn-helix transcriptional regulator [Clostridia bacterium]
MAVSDFPRVLTHLRKEAGISQKKAAESLGVSQALLSHYEKGIRECGLLFLVRAADFYGVSVDYLLGRSLEKKGSCILLEEVPDEDAGGQGNRGAGSLLPVLNKKLICNSVTVVEDLLGATGDKDLINKASMYLQISVYQMFRRLYNGNKENPQTFFGAEEDTYGMMADGAMKKLEAEIQQKLKKIKIPAMDEETLRAKYPLFATSLLTLLQNAESAIGARKK